MSKMKFNWDLCKPPKGRKCRSGWTRITIPGGQKLGPKGVVTVPAKSACFKGGKPTKEQLGLELFVMAVVGKRIPRCPVKR